MGASRSAPASPSIACHASGTSGMNSTYVASPHTVTTTVDTWDATSNVPPGYVWSDPFNDWKTAFDAVTGSGHNTLPWNTVGASRDRSFPVTSFPGLGPTSATYTWTVQPDPGQIDGGKTLLFVVVVGIAVGIGVAAAVAANSASNFSGLTFSPQGP